MRRATEESYIVPGCNTGEDPEDVLEIWRFPERSWDGLLELFLAVVCAVSRVWVKIAWTPMQVRASELCARPKWCSVTPQTGCLASSRTVGKVASIEHICAMSVMVSGEGAGIERW